MMQTRCDDDVLTVPAVTHAHGTVKLSGSKSISNRALLLAALCPQGTRLTGLLQAEDTERMLDSLRLLGATIEQKADECTIAPGKDFPSREAELFVGNAGTVSRMLTAFLAFAGGSYRLDGVKRMRERPIADLVDALREIGARIEYTGQTGCLPLRILPARLTSDTARVRGNVSSQFLTALLLASAGWARTLNRPFHIQILGNLISRPYVEMTVSMMRSFGADVVKVSDGYVVGTRQMTPPETYAIEGDASGASYFLALGALTGGPVRVVGIGRNSLQGDVHFADVLAQMGADVTYLDNAVEVSRKPGTTLRGISINCLAIPDAAMTFVPMALCTEGAVELTGIASWRVKETDRLDAMVCEMRKFGARVTSGPDWIRVERGSEIIPARVATYNDHRMAMSFALAACAGIPVQIENPACTAKTFPDFFKTLFTMIGRNPSLA